MKKLYLYFVLELCVLTMSQKTALDKSILNYIYRGYRNWLTHSHGTRNEERISQLRKKNKFQDEVPIDVSFPCNVTAGRSSNVPESVHHLRPGDIDVIAAMGDSLTIGAAVTSIYTLEVNIENRGIVGSIGGQGTWRQYLTLPNILKEFNPKLVGYSLGDSISTDPAAQLNVAEGGAMSRDITFMATYLVNKIKEDPRIDINKHWKLISLMIGSNDFCANMCTTSSPWTMLNDHKTDLINTLRILRDNLPRTFVALIPPPHLKELITAHHGRESLQCYVSSMIGCSCMFALQFRDQRPEYYKIIERWQNIDEEVANYPEFHRNDFTVEFLPTLKNAIIPLAEDGFSDPSYLNADCFHWSQKLHALYANNLWNNLLEPVGNKRRNFTSLFKKFLCPTSERPFLMTYKNSQNNET
ncbi:phospholipase B1, membrane-associated-like isoform X2 [Bombus affinis]|uniref:phospholipase B1, membrane-associated-like isoform X2 n=2 Tax=Bombus affinis TaxID=309941 RepID=UPI0021B8443C|nr:phospholipase B1, membrane-associated-like isoform X2 [Bombus affinis]XP_050598513.1 phospholipase B1, membrane-associated-like isoform X2 [Bombus affinis]XP_050598514.1 phospholipase B1, membrane-associated-like isoform X2 [Bombus affinis]XP_050598515.1 phospholipase B1, membrane-associated-like isoform X2 [Bombus affinis]